MATHSSVLAWRIPGTEEPGGLYGVAQIWTGLKQLSSSGSTGWIRYFVPSIPHTLEKYVFSVVLVEWSIDVC